MMPGQIVLTRTPIAARSRAPGTFIPRMPPFEGGGALSGLPLEAAPRGGVDDDAALAVGVGGLGLGYGRGGDPHQVERPDQVDRDDLLVAGQVVRGAVAAHGPQP